jgi:hypothetical protein
MRRMEGTCTTRANLPGSRAISAYFGLASADRGRSYPLFLSPPVFSPIQWTFEN